MSLQYSRVEKGEEFLTRVRIVQEGKRKEYKRGGRELKNFIFLPLNYGEYLDTGNALITGISDESSSGGK